MLHSKHSISGVVTTSHATVYHVYRWTNFASFLLMRTRTQHLCRIGYGWSSSQKGLSPSTVSSYLAVIYHVHKVYNWTNPTSQVLVQKAVTGLRRIRQVGDSRAPVSEDMLHNIYHILETYELWLFRSAYCLAFYSLLRVSELVYITAEMAHRPLFYSDIKVSTSGSKVGLLFKIRFSKTDQQGRSITLRTPVLTGKSVCPVFSIKKILSVRNRSDGIMIIHEDGSPLSRYQFNAVLRKSVIKLVLPRPSPGQVGAILQTLRASTSAMPDVVWCADDDITAHIPNQLREKIWGHQYVNLALTLKGSA
ncbi:hypothetical protein KUTeg_013117 [Tegillarca granosa]|uniref:Uncharacterized protein n=1 Tax=Tegillarca granosa TaxID=220873 RepID=A0ABQ9ESS3_TEGGR|nr:hypothetical protein KUTeg_013117 [Tegillarca granosa]